MGKMYSAESLNPRAKIRIQRKQFEPLPEPWLRKFTIIRQRMLDLYATDEIMRREAYEFQHQGRFSIGKRPKSPVDPGNSLENIKRARLDELVNGQDKIENTDWERLWQDRAKPWDNGDFTVIKAQDYEVNAGGIASLMLEEEEFDPDDLQKLNGEKKRYQPLDFKLATTYIHQVAIYANELRQKQPVQFYAPSELDPPLPPTVYSGPSCCILSQSLLDAIENADNKNEELSKINSYQQIGYKRFRKSVERCVAQIARDNFLSLDYLFIPYLFEEREHCFLPGIAPKQRFVFTIDSYDCRGMEESADEEEYPLKALLLILNEFNPDGRENWPIYTQWQHRSETKDESPDAPQQRDSYNCGVFMATNALNLAFGYDLNCASQNDFALNTNNPFTGKRPRMFAELANGGFGGPHFDYDLIKISTEEYPQREIEKAIEEQDVNTDGFAASMEWQGSEDSNETNYVDDSDDGSPVQRGFSGPELPAETNTPIFQISPPIRSGTPAESGRPARRGEIDEATEDFGRISILQNQSRRRPQMTGSRATGMTREEDDWPRQFPRSDFQKQGFLYAITDPCFSEFQSTMQLIESCKRYQIKDYEPWSSLSQRSFRRWMENEVAAARAKITPGALKPIKGIGNVRNLSG